MFDPKRLLQYEFFPAELPPCFNSDDLAANAQHAIQAASKLNRAFRLIFFIHSICNPPPKLFRYNCDATRQ